MPRRRAGFVVAAGLGIFFLLTILVWTGTADGLDHAVLRFADGHDSPAGRNIARILTDVLSPVVETIVLVAGAALIAQRQRSMRPLLVAAATLLEVSVVVLGVKYAVDRPLPRSPDAAMGFPSGHTAGTLSLLGTLALLASTGRPWLRRRMLAVVAGLTMLVVAALVYAGFHWLTDTLASVALSVAILAAAASAADLPTDSQPRQLVRTAERPRR